LKGRKSPRKRNRGFQDLDVEIPPAYTTLSRDPIKTLVAIEKFVRLQSSSSLHHSNFHEIDAKPRKIARMKEKVVKPTFQSLHALYKKEPPDPNLREKLSEFTITQLKQLVEVETHDLASLIHITG